MGACGRGADVRMLRRVGVRVVVGVRMWVVVGMERQLVMTNRV